MTTGSTSADPNAPLREHRDALRAALAAIGDLRPGSLVESYRRCGKSNCHCAAEGARGHGPNWLLTRQVDGKTVTRTIPRDAVERTRRQLAEYQRFKALAHDLIEASEQWCQAELRTVKATSQEAAKKGASQRPSKPRSSRKSKH